MTTNSENDNGYSNNSKIGGKENPGASSIDASTAAGSSSDNWRPKRKSGSFTELSLACLPLKRQKPENITSPLSRRLAGGNGEAEISNEIGSSSSSATGSTNPFSFISR